MSKLGAKIIQAMMRHFKKTIVFLILGVAVCITAIFMTSKYDVDSLKYIRQNCISIGKALVESNKTNAEVVKRNVVLHIENDSLHERIIYVEKENRYLRSVMAGYKFIARLPEKRDTIAFSDTIFSSPNVKIDTVMKNDWYELNIGLRYPGNIIVSPMFKDSFDVEVNEQHFINKPSKVFFVRWFQKKSTVVNVNVRNINPYSDADNRTFRRVLGKNVQDFVDEQPK